MAEDNKKIIPDHASFVRSFTSEKYGERFEPLRTLQEAQGHSDGVVIFEGDYGGAIYLTCPVRLVRCSAQALQHLLHDIDKKLIDHHWGLMVCYERLAPGSPVSGGWGGGLITEGVWLHDRVEALSLRKPIEEVLSGSRERLGD
jgi:hypothetical protein